MIGRLFASLAILGLAVTVVPALAQTQTRDSDQLVAAYEAMRDAFNKRNGSAVADLASDESINLFGRLREIAARGSRKQVEALPPAQRFFVLRTRLKLGQALATLDGKSLLSAAAAQGMIGESLPSTPARADLAITGTRASAIVRGIDGKPTPYKLSFAKQRGGWRVDIGPLLGIADDEIRRAAREDKLGENQLIEQLLGLLSPSGKFEPSLWEPVAANAPAAPAPGNPPPVPGVPPPTGR